MEQLFIEELIAHGFTVWRGDKGELMIAWRSEMIPENSNDIHPRETLAKLKKQFMQCETLYLVEAV